MRRTMHNQFPPVFGQSSFVMPAGFSDSSWGNDACPSIEGMGVKIWIETEDPELRDSGASFRYMAYRIDDPADYPEPMHQSDDWSDVLAFIATLKE